MALTIVSTGFGREAAAYVCPHCGTAATHRLERLGVQGFQKFDPFVELRAEDRSSEIRHPASGEWRRAQCDICRGWVVWRDDQMVYPRQLSMPVPHPQMAEAAQELYNEARLVYSVSPRAAGIMVRAVIERVLKSADPDAPTRSTLDQRIARVQSRVSGGLWQSLQIVRHVGNKAVHVDDMPDELVSALMDEETADIAEILFETCNSLVDELIGKPARIDAMYIRVPERVRRAAQARAEPAP